MTFQELLSDPNFQTVVVPLFTALIPVVLGWFLGFLPAELKKAKWDRWLKLVIEAAVLVFVGRLLPEAMAAFNKDDPTSKVIGALYGVVLVILIGMMVADVVQLVRKPSTLTAAEMDEARWQDNRQTLMDKVRVKWIDGVLNKSLYQQARISVGLEECPEMVGMEWQTVGEEKQVLPPGSRLLDRFANLGGGGTLLVLGEPGAGKTTLLLELAQDLSEATDFQELKQPIPIVLNLAAWGTQKFPEDKMLVFTYWLLEELWQQYQVRKEVGNTWLEQQKWTLLLDGLDEVKPQYRDACVEALNQFRQKFGNIEIVLCCRIADYQKLNTHLEGFQAAVYVQPLTDKHVDDYLKQGKGALVGIATALEADSSLRDLTNTPLFLWILTLAYRNRPAQELLDLSKDQRLKLLFDRYIERMFAQRYLPELEQQQMMCWLRGIAKKTGTGKEFLIERMQPQDWLETARDKWLYCLIVGLIFGLIVGLSFGLSFGLIVSLIVSLITCLIIGLIFGLVVGLNGGLNTIDLVEALVFSVPRFSGREIWTSMKAWLIIGLIIGLSVGLIGGLIGGLNFGLIFGLVIGLVVSLIGGLIFGLIGGLKVDITNRTFPNQGIWRSLRTMNIMILVALVVSIILYSCLTYTLFRFLEPSLAQIIVSSVIGLPIWGVIVAGGGFACIQHCAMRLALFPTEQIPRNFITFFTQAEDHLFIYRTGGSYVFVHRYLQEHFANLSFDET